jgi:hypothetical protein
MPGLVIDNVNFVLLDEATGMKSVRRGEDGAIKPKMGG